MELDPDAYLVESGVPSAAVARVNKMFEENPGMYRVLGIDPNDSISVKLAELYREEDEADKRSTTSQ